MSVPLFLLNLPFLLLFLLVLCGRKKKKNNEETPQASVKSSTSSKTSKEPPAATMLSSEGKPKASSNVEPIEPKKINEEETQDASGEREIKLANVILKIHKDFDPKKLKEEQEANRKKAARERAKRAEKSPGHRFLTANAKYKPRRTLPVRIQKDYPHANQAYKSHKCTNPEKKRTEDEQCDVCKAYFAWIGMLYELHLNGDRIGVPKRYIEKDFYDYGGKLPSFMENPEWQKAKEQMNKNMREEKKFDPPVGTKEERAFQIEEEGKKLRLIIDQVDYWTNSDVEFRQRIAKDFEETRKIYKGHDCRDMPPSIDIDWTPYLCLVCSEYMGDKWTGRLYKEVSENEKRFPDGMKKQLEEDFFFHRQKFETPLPTIVEHPRWIEGKKRIAHTATRKYDSNMTITTKTIRD